MELYRHSDTFIVRGDYTLLWMSSKLSVYDMEYGEKFCFGVTAAMVCDHPQTCQFYISEPNKCRGVTLMDISTKIYSSIMCGKLFKMISKHGVKFHFGYTSGVGCQDITFMI